MIEKEHFVFEVLGKYINNAEFQDEIPIQSEGVLVTNQTLHT